MPVSGGQGVRMVGTDNCVNCGSFPCPEGLNCKPGRPSSSQEPSEAFSTCLGDEANPLAEAISVR
jgi:hypothetical protein